MKQSFVMNEYEDDEAEDQRSVRNSILKDMDVNMDSQSTFRFGTTSTIEAHDQNEIRQMQPSPNAVKAGPFKKKLAPQNSSLMGSFLEMPTITSKNLLAKEKSMQLYEECSRKQA